MVEEVYKARRISSKDLALLESKSKGKGLPKNNGSGIALLGGGSEETEKRVFFFFFFF